jgi:hypothetical protein
VATERFSYALRTIWPSLVQAATLLLCFISGLALDHLERLGPTIVVLTSVLGLSLGRTQRHGGTGHRLLSLAALPLISVACTEVGRLFVQHPNVADTLFTGALGLSIWMRRFGPWAARAGTLIALPFVALLVTPVPVPVAAEASALTARSMLWSALAAVVAYCWVWLVRAGAERIGLIEPLPRHEPGRSAARPSAPSGPSAPATSARSGSARIPASTRMAVQMTLSLGLAFVIGRAVFAPHWVWIVLTAFIVNSGNRGRGDVLYKSVQRVLGASAGTVVATLLAGLLPPHDNVAVVIILIVVVIGGWLRTISYVYWAACVTSVLSLLQGYFGEGRVGLIGERLLQIVLGGVLAAVIAWFVLPVKSTDVLRRRLADCLAPLTDLLIAAGREPGTVAARRTEFASALEGLKQVTPSITAHRMLLLGLARLRGNAPQTPRPPHPADAIEALRGCEPAVRVLAELASCRPEQLRAPSTAALLKHATGNVAAARRVIGRRAEARYRAPSTSGSAPGTTAREAVLRIDAAMRVICETYGGPYLEEAANPPARAVKA